MFKNVEIMEPESFPKTEKEARLCWKFLLPSWKVTFFWIENRFSELASSNSTYIYCCFESEGRRPNEWKWKCKRTKSWTIRKASKIFRLLITSIKLDRTLFPGWVDDHFDQVAIRHLALFVVLIATDAFVPSCCRQRKQHPRISSVWLRLVSIWRDKQRV